MEVCHCDESLSLKTDQLQACEVWNIGRESSVSKTIPVCVQCDGHIKTTVFCNRMTHFPPQGTLKFHQRTRTKKNKKIDLLKVNRSYQSWSLRREVGVKLNLEVRIMETQQEIVLHYSNRLSHLTFSAHQEQRENQVKSLSPPRPIGALSGASTPYKITVSCENFKEALLL